jgi:hypothetical protein
VISRWHYLGMSLFEFFEAQHDADVIGLIVFSAPCRNYGRL